MTSLTLVPGSHLSVLICFIGPNRSHGMCQFRKADCKRIFATRFQGLGRQIDGRWSQHIRESEKILTAPRSAPSFSRPSGSGDTSPSVEIVHTFRRVLGGIAGSGGSERRSHPGPPLRNPGARRRTRRWRAPPASIARKRPQPALAPDHHPNRLIVSRRRKARLSKKLTSPPRAIERRGLRAGRLSGVEDVRGDRADGRGRSWRRRATAGQVRHAPPPPRPSLC